MGYTSNPKASGPVLQGCRGRAANLILFGLLVAVLIICQLPAFGQHAAGSIAGLVADKSGAVIPGAKVTVKNEANNNTFDGVTNGSGNFSFPTILPGSYTVTISAPGLQTYEMEHIVVTQGAAVGIPTITLQVATTKEQIEIVASGDVAVPIDSPQASQTLNQNMITDLSIVGRDAAELMKIMPGMAMTSGLGQSMWSSYTTASNTGPIGAFSANGTQPNGAVTMTSDGANLLDPGNQGTQTANVNQNQVAEVSILTSAYDASFAKGPVTFQAYGKSGSAQYHGGAYLYTRNGVFNSIDANDKALGYKPISDSFYYPGGDFGGPVLIPGSKFNRNRDKLFFYSAFEYMKQQPAGSSYNFFIPTSQMLQGNFSPAYIASLGTGFANARSNGAVIPCASSSTGTGCGNMTNIVGGMIPQSMLDPNSAALLKLDPTPNLNIASNPTGSNYDYFLGPPQNRWELRLRGDYNINDKTKLYFSWNHQHETDLSPFYVWWWGSPSTLPYPSPQQATQISQVYSANLVHVFSPTLTNEFVFADAKFSNPVVLTNPDAVNPSKVGFSYTGFFKDPYTPQLPDVLGWNNVTNGFYTEQYGSVFNGQSNTFGKISNTPNLSDNINYVVGKHTLKAGFYWDFAQNYQSSVGVGSTMGQNDEDTWGAVSTGNPLADEIIGHSAQFSQSNGGVTNNFKYYTYGWYVNDSWKAGRRLTLTLGIRLDHLGNWVTSNCPGYPVGTTDISPCPGLAVWDPATYVNSSKVTTPWDGAQWHAINSAIPLSGFPSKSVFPLPRVGAAYDIFGDGKTVVRGGIGLYRYQLAYNSVSGSAFNTPVNVESLASTWGCCTGWNNFSAFSPSSGVAGEGSGPTGLLQMGDERTPYTWTYNLTVDQRLPGRSVLEFQYTGNKSKDEMLRYGLASQDLVPLGAYFKPDPITGAPGGILGNTASFNSFPTQDYNPLQFYTNMQLVSHGSYSNYNAFIVSWQKQTGRITFTTNYTFSKVLGVRDGESDNGPGDGNTLWPYSIAANYGVLSWDHTHIFNAAYVFNLPSPIKGNALAGGAVNGWVLSGITQMQSGAPIQPNASGTLNPTWPSNYSNTVDLGTQSPTLVPLLTCDPRKGLSSGQYFNASCFTLPPPGQEGNIIWPYIHGPAFFNSDLAIYKRFAFKEHQRVELRFSAFNFLNHPLPQFGMSGANDLNLNFTTNTGATSLTNTNPNTDGKPFFMSNNIRRVIEFAAKYNF